jgi:hypothetical protein
MKNLFFLLLAALAEWGCQTKGGDTKQIESHSANGVVVSLLNETGELAQGPSRFTVAFHSASTNQPVDVGRVSVSAAMVMPGMPMSAGIELTPSGETGKYRAQGAFGMSGAWRFEVRWDGPAGQGSVSFNSNVR